MENEKDSGLLLPLGLLILLIIVLVASTAGLSSVNCRAAWKKSGLNSTWEFGAGCLVEVSPNQWVPERKVRIMEVKPQKK